MHAAPSHALSETERARIVAVASEPRLADMPPARIVPAPADKGTYIASESGFHRMLRHAGQGRPTLAERHALYQAARDGNPRRWSAQTRDCS